MISIHKHSTFKNHCITPPRDPNTKLPRSANERNDSHDTQTLPDKSYKKKIDQSGESYYCVEGVGLQKHKIAMLQKQKDGLHVSKHQSNISAPVESIDNDPDRIVRAGRNVTADVMYSPKDLSSLLSNDEEFYNHLQTLKQENKKTLRILNRLYNSHQSEDGEIAPDGTFIPSAKSRQAWSGESVFNSIIGTTDRLKDLEFTSEETKCRDRAIDNDDTDSDGDSYDSKHDYFQGWRHKKANPPPNILPDEDDVKSFRGRHSSYDVIDNMWERFSVEDYAPNEKSPEPTKSEKEEWKPKITIPRPFDMTVRESLQAEQRARKREKILQEAMQKSIAEEAELKKKFKAQPLPASTYLPLYSELKIQEEDRREKIRYLSKALLDSKIKPFNFTKREEAMKAIRKHQVLKTKGKREKDGHLFKAQPFPEKLFDLSVEDKRAEQDEYRKIKMEMRSLELLASASLPPNMKARGEKQSNIRRQKLQKYLKEGQKKFQPNINHDIPDFEILQKKFEKEMMTKRKEKAPTVCQPFNLHTGKVPGRRAETGRSGSIETEPKKQNSLRRHMSRSMDNLQRSSSLSDSIPYSLTETSRRRQESLKKTKEAEIKEEEAQRAKEKEKRKRERQLRQEVARRSSPNDLKNIMKAQSEEKMREFRRADAERKREYKDQLMALKSKLENRPLLFEREALRNARQKAEKRYQQILLDAGVDVDIVNDLASNSQVEDTATSSASDENEDTGLRYDTKGEQSMHTLGYSEYSNEFSNTLDTHETTRETAPEGAGEDVAGTGDESEELDDNLSFEEDNEC